MSILILYFTDESIQINLNNAIKDAVCLLYEREVHGGGLRILLKFSLFTMIYNCKLIILKSNCILLGAACNYVWRGDECFYVALKVRNSS